MAVENPRSWTKSGRVRSQVISLEKVNPHLQEFFHLFDVTGEREEQHDIPFVDTCIACGTMDRIPFLHRCNDRPFRHANIADHAARDRRCRHDLRFDHFRFGIADGIDLAYPAMADVAQDRGHGCCAGVNKGVDVQGLHQGGKAVVINQRDNEWASRGFGAGRRQQIGFVVIGNGQKRICLVQVGLFQQVHIKTIAVEHNGALQRFGGTFSTFA